MTTTQQDTAADDSGASTDEVVVRARGLGLKGPWGHSFGPSDFEITRGGVTVIAAPRSRGRDALMLSICGRMHTTAGTIEIFGSSDMKKAFRQSSVCLIDQIDEIEQSISVRDLVTENRRWTSSWYKLIRPANHEDLVAVCGPTFGENIELPPLKEYADRLPELQLTMTRIALANHPARPLLVVGGIDDMGNDEERHTIYRQLAELGANQTIVVADENARREIPGTKAIIELPHLTTGGNASGTGPELR